MSSTKQLLQNDLGNCVVPITHTLGRRAVEGEGQPHERLGKAWHSVSLGSNPFCTRFVRPGAIPYRFSLDGVGDADRLAALTTVLQTHPCAQIVGPHGSGKTTLISALMPIVETRFSSVTRVQLFATTDVSMRGKLRHCLAMAASVDRAIAEPSGHASFNRNALLIIDGAEQLGRLAWLRMVRRSRQRGYTVLATSHRDLPLACVLHRTHVTPAMIGALTRSLVFDAAPNTADCVLGELVRRDLTTTTDVRKLWFDLYDVVQSSTRRSSPAVERSNSL